MQASFVDAEKEGIPAGLYRRRWLILVTLCGSLLAVMLANTSLNLALPSMATDLELSSLDLTWIVEIYTLVFASLLFTSGAVGDRFGRKAIMQAGLGIFVVASVYAAFTASTSAELTQSRARARSCHEST
jgi:MFS family permease